MKGNPHGCVLTFRKTNKYGENVEEEEMKRKNGEEYEFTRQRYKNKVM